MVTLECSAIQIRHNICRMMSNKSDANVEDINPKNIYDDVNI